MAMAGTGRKEMARQRRSVARLMAVQALYQQAMTGAATAPLLAEFHAHRLRGEAREGELAPAEAGFFDDLVKGAMAREAELDSRIAAFLTSGWTLERLDPLMRAILRAGAYEMVARPDVPLAAVVSEYVDVARAFYPRGEAGFVNAVLDRLGHAARNPSGRPSGGGAA